MGVPVTMVAEYEVQVPVEEVEIVQKEVPKCVLQGVETIVEVPHVVREERMVPVPQTQTVEVIKQVANPRVQDITKDFPKIEPREKIVEQEVAATIIREKGVEVPQQLTVEVLRQKASSKVQQKIVQTGRERVISIAREEVVLGQAQAVQGEYYEAEAIQEVSLRKTDEELLAIGYEEAQIVSQMAETIIVHEGTAEDPVPPKQEWPEGVTHWALKTHKKTKYTGGVETIATRPMTYSAPVTTVSPMTYSAPTVTYSQGYSAASRQFYTPVRR